MSRALAIVEEVESALRDAPAAKRTEVLRRVTDLFVASADTHNENQSALFDGVMGQLIQYVESKALRELAERIAPMPSAPVATIGRLARHDDIEVSGPVLEKSPRLTDNDLVEITASKSQAHLAEIARRPQLNEKVTDALVDYGDNNVATRLAVNAGAHFSKLGMAKMVMRADGDEQLTLSIAARNDIPLKFFQQLLAQATVVVRKKLVAQAKPEQRAAVEQIMTEVTNQIVPRTALQARSQASQQMAAISQDTELLRTKILKFANEHRLPETLAGLSMLSQAPFEQIERLFYSPHGLGVVVLCKALGFDWLSADAVILASPVAGNFDQKQLDELHEQFEALSVPSAQRLLRFWQGRQAVIDVMTQKIAGAAAQD